MYCIKDDFYVASKEGTSNITYYFFIWERYIVLIWPTQFDLTQWLLSFISISIYYYWHYLLNHALKLLVVDILKSIETDNTN